MGGYNLPILGTDLAAWYLANVPEKRKAPPPHPPGTFEERRAKAQKELAEKGIDAEQAATYTPLNQVIYRAVTPWGYGGHAADDLPASGRLRKELHAEHPAREDAWRIYLGMPQKEGTFEVSPYQPSTSQDKAALYYRLKSFWPAQLKNYWNIDQKFGNDVLSANEVSTMLKDVSEPHRQRLGVGIGLSMAPGRADDFQTAVMGNYKIGGGKDENGPYASYYDRWDLDRDPTEGQEGRFGKPFELYDRLYYNPQTQEIYWNGPPQKAQSMQMMQRRK